MPDTWPSRQRADGKTGYLPPQTPPPCGAQVDSRTPDGTNCDCHDGARSIHLWVARPTLTAPSLLTLQYHQRADNGRHEMASCRVHIRNTICQPYHEYIFNEPGRVSDCQNFFGEEQAGNPFRWPDPNLVSWPDPH